RSRVRTRGASAVCHRLTQVWGRGVEEIQAGETIGQGAGDLWVAGKERVVVRLLPGREQGLILLHRPRQPRVGSRPLLAALRQAVEAGAPVFPLSHDEPPSERLSRATARAHRFLTLSTLRPMRRATSGKPSPSRWARMITSRYLSGRCCSASASSTACSRR